MMNNYLNEMYLRSFNFLFLSLRVVQDFLGTVKSQNRIRTSNTSFNIYLYSPSCRAVFAVLSK